MKVLGYLYCLVAVAVAVMLLFDSLLPEALIGQIWLYFDYVICIALLISVILSLKDQIGNGLRPLKPSLLVQLFTFLVFTETFVQHESGVAIPAMQWLWVDSFVVVILLYTGVRYILSEQDSTESSAA